MPTGRGTRATAEATPELVETARPAARGQAEAAFAKARKEVAGHCEAADQKATILQLRLISGALAVVTRTASATPRLFRAAEYRPAVGKCEMAVERVEKTAAENFLAMTGVPLASISKINNCSTVTGWILFVSVRRARAGCRRARTPPPRCDRRPRAAVRPARVPSSRRWQSRAAPRDRAQQW